MTALQGPLHCSNPRSFATFRPCNRLSPGPTCAGTGNGRRHRLSGKTVRPLFARAASRRSAQFAVCASAEEPVRIMIAGAPAAGKGTQCAKIVEKYGLAHVCVGDILRDQITKGTDAGKRAKEFMDNGDLVPNEIVVDMVKSSLGEAKDGWLLDGYPRSKEQAEAIEKEGIRPDIFLLLEVPDEELVERVVGRRSDPETGEIYHLKFKPPPPEIADRLVQRSDDTEEKVKNRLNTYHSNLASILDIYEDLIVRIDGNRSMDEVFASIMETMDEKVGKKATV